jgi:hypothetical protein
MTAIVHLLYQSFDNIIAHIDGIVYKSSGIDAGKKEINHNHINYLRPYTRRTMGIIKYGHACAQILK